MSDRARVERVAVTVARSHGWDVGVDERGPVFVVVFLNGKHFGVVLLLVAEVAEQPDDDGIEWLIRDQLPADDPEPGPRLH